MLKLVENLKRYAWLVLALVVAGFFLGGAVKAGGLFGEVMAAWVQAIGSIGAIVGAIWIDQSATRRGEQASRQRAAQFAQLAIAAIDRVRVEMAVCRDAYRTGLDVPKNAAYRFSDVATTERHSLERLEPEAPNTELAILIRRAAEDISHSTRAGSGSESNGAIVYNNPEAWEDYLTPTLASLDHTLAALRRYGGAA